MKVITFSINVVFVRGFPVGKIAEKAASRSVFLTIWHCILSAEFCPLAYALM